MALVKEAMLVVAYLLGSIPFAYIFVKIAGGVDVRRVGSGNVGATNAMRAAGWRWAIVVALLDIGKGVLAVVLMRQVTANPAWAAAAGVMAVVGHCFPVWLSFQGGKGVATAAGAFGTIALAPIGVVAVVWVALLALTRIVSLSSVIAAASFPVLLYLIKRPPLQVALCAVAAVSVIIWRHRSNMVRLVQGDEPRLGKKGSDS
jgi:acyl phosphate:glycerol-3-phosphate acyltransferase